MKIHNLKVRGAIGIKKGMGLDELELDFSGLSGLIALAGPNGHGKTTLLENLSPYRMFASRGGALQRHFFLKDSFRDLTFEYCGDIYRTLVKINSNSDRSEGFVWKNDEPQIDGKVSNYNQYIENLLGSSNLFYNSVFCAQNSDKLSDMTTGQLKQLFVEFLRLDRLAKYESMAKQACTLLNGSTVQIERNIQATRDHVSTIGDVDARLKEAEYQCSGLRERVLDTGRSIDAEKKTIEGLKEVQASNAVNIERQKDLKKALDDLRNDRTRAYSSHSQQLDEQGQSIAKKKEAIAKHQDLIGKKQDIQNAAARIENLKEGIDLVQKCGANIQANLENLYKKVNELDDEKQSIQAKMDALKNRDDIEKTSQKVDIFSQTLRNIEENVTGLKTKLKEKDQNFDIVRIDSAISSAKDSMALLDQRGDCPVDNPKCSFVVSAIKARDELKNLEKEKEGLLKAIELEKDEILVQITNDEDAYPLILEDLKAHAILQNQITTRIDNELDSLHTRLNEANTAQQKIRVEIEKVRIKRTEKTEELNQLHTEIEGVRGLAEKEPELRAAEAQVNQIQNDIISIESQMKRDKEQYDKTELQGRSKIRDLELRLENVEIQIDGKVSEKIEAAHKRLSDLQANETDLSQSLKSEEADIITIQKQVDEVTGMKKNIEASQEELGRLTAEASQWLYLQNACGKTGLQALEIDGVAPLITGYANDLLSSSFGPNFSVNLITQDPETGREVLDIIVIRGDGSETRLENLSGGEKVWVLKSLRLAMTLISKEKSGRNFQTILADEEDGPLDAEKAQSFVGLYKAILEVGGFESCFYISHNPDVVGMADHRIEFSEGGVQII